MSYKNLRITGIPAPLPTDYDRQVNFTDFEILNPGDPPRGVDLDAEFNAVQQALDETQDRLELIQRDDGALANESVGLDQLKNEARIGVNTPSDWQAFTQYAVNDSVIVNDGAWYIAIESHVSSGTFADDLAAGNWEELIDLTPYTVEARNWANRAVDSLVPEGDGVDDYSALHHRTYAETAQSAAETARDAAQAAQTGAEDAETGALSAQNGAELAETGAVTAQTNAETAETNAVATLANFQGQYWGAYASAPATDTNGDPAGTGDLYFNTTNSRLHVYSGAQWLAVPDVVAADIIFTATGNIVATNVQDALAELDGDLTAAENTLNGRITSEVDTLDADKVDRTATTGAAILPSGTTAQRPAGQAGYLRHSSTLSALEAFISSAWRKLLAESGSTIVNINETVQNLTDGTVDASLGAIANITLSAAGVLDLNNMPSGRSVTLHISGGDVHGMDWSTNQTITWHGDVPLLGAVHTVEFEQVGSTLYGYDVGEAS